MRNKWLTPRAVKLHILCLFAVLACLALGGWQLYRALSDHNQLSWAYTFEWPFFAGYVSWMWWKLLHEEPEFGGPPRDGTRRDQPSNDDREMAEYNEYLANLDRSPRSDE